jgi:hypothetical protein
MRASNGRVLRVTAEDTPKECGDASDDASHDRCIRRSSDKLFRRRRTLPAIALRLTPSRRHALMMA